MLAKGVGFDFFDHEIVSLGQLLFHDCTFAIPSNRKKISNLDRLLK